MSSKISLKMSLKMQSKMDKFHIMVSKNIIWGVSGLVLGIIINDSVIYISNNLKIKYLFIQNIIQITFCALVLALLHTYYLYGWDWQHIMPELFFVSFFFGVQYKLLTNIQQSYMLIDKLNYN